MSTQCSDFIDMARLRERFDDDHELLEEIFSVFLSESPVRRTGIEAAMAEEDLPRLAGLAHSLKGVAATLFAEPLRLAAYTLEKAARSGDVSATRAAVAPVLDLIDRTAACLP